MWLFTLFLYLLPIGYVENQNFGTLNQAISFYPSSLVISHSAKPLIFYDDTRLMHITMELPTISIGEPFYFTNHSCSLLKANFYNHLLQSMLTVQETAQRLLSLPGFTTLIECNTFLSRYYQLETGLPSRMACPRVYRNSMDKCKRWAIANCKGLTLDERYWLKDKRGKSRKARSSWFCTAGALGIFRALYIATGKSCETNHVEHLKSTLRRLTATMDVSRHLIHTVNGKLVHLFKVTDKVNTKLNNLIFSVRRIDKVFKEWKIELERQSNTVNCNDYLNMAFLSKYRALTAILRFFEVQDVVTQLTQLNNKILVGSLDLPQPMFSQFVSQFQNDPMLELTAYALKNNLAVLANTAVDVEHNHDNVTVNVLTMVPEIPNKESFCTIEHLTPLKFNISNICYEGPIRQSDLALITCPYTKHVIKTATLNKCFISDNSLLCPTNIMRVVSDVLWLGFPWRVGAMLKYPRYHVSAKSCEDMHPLIHLGGRYYLSTTSGTLKTNVGTFTVSPLKIIHFPCNVTFVGMKAGLSKCPKRMEINLPIFKDKEISYIPWNGNDKVILKLHYDSLNIPKPTKIDNNITRQLDRLYELYDRKMKKDIDADYKDIESIKEESTTTTDEIILMIIGTLTVLNSIVLLILIIMCCRAPKQLEQQPPPLPKRATHQRKRHVKE